MLNNLEDTSLRTNRKDSKNTKQSSIPSSSPLKSSDSLQYGESSYQNQQQHLKSKSSSMELTSLVSHSSQRALHRHLSLWDLICLGVGATIGSGVFVLVGMVAREYAGPSSCISWALSGLAACLSGICYAELSSHIPASGGSYCYAKVTMGDWIAVIVASCLTLEYMVSGAAVARSWGDKFVSWLEQEVGIQFIASLSNPVGSLNIMALLISAVSTALLLDGVEESKTVTNWMTTIKVMLVLFMGLGGISLFQVKNWKPFVPPAFGWAGTFRGSTLCSFGYLGYDEVCCVAGEAKYPQRDLPRAVIGTLAIVGTLTILCAVALTGMQPYAELDGFPGAFRANGWEWAAQLTAFGEVLTLPVVVLVCLLAQPRLQFAMAEDGLLPQVFGRIDPVTGNLWSGTLISGVVMTLVAAVVPFDYLDSLISAGILVAFSISDSCVILVRRESPPGKPFLLERLLMLFHVLSFVTGLLLTYCWRGPFGRVCCGLSCVATIGTVIRIAVKCPTCLAYGGVHAPKLTELIVESGIPNTDELMTASFKMPMVPYLPCLAAFVNWYLVAQLDMGGLAMLVGYLGLVSLLYLLLSPKKNVAYHQYNVVNEGDDYE